MNNTIVKQGWDFKVEPAPGPRPAPSPAPPEKLKGPATQGEDWGNGFFDALKAWDRVAEVVYGPTRNPSLADAAREAGGVLHETLQVESDPNGIDQHAPGAKCDAGKQLAGVLLDFSRALSKVADIGTFGAQKYTRLGWAQVPNGEQRYLDAMVRHLLKHGQGEEHDPDHGIEHLAAVIWNACAALELKLRREGA